MRRIDCQNTRREVEAASPGDLLSSTANDHLKACPECGTFREEEWNLRKLVSSLGTVNAPGDFDFRLRARLAGEKHGANRSSAIGRFSFGFRPAALAAALLIAGTLLFVGLRTQQSNTQVAHETSPSTFNTQASAPAQVGIDAPQNASADGAGVVAELGNPQTKPVDVKPASSGSSRHSRRNRAAFRQSELISAQEGGRILTRDLAGTPAKVVKATNAGAEPLWSNAFPIGASYQSLKVLLDDGRGSSRTISLPSVSFGSQRVLTHGKTPVLATARDSW
jgi:hypothetical protein